MTDDEDYLEIKKLEYLSDSDAETQTEIMREWFFKHFEDPAERTPYESAEGGYIWVWGGPYDAFEELQAQFEQEVPDDVIVKLAVNLSLECWQWAPKPSREDYDDFLVDDIALITEYYENLGKAIEDIKSLLTTKLEVGSVSNCFYRLLFVNVITALETYLSDAFINTTVSNTDIMRRFIETTPEFKNEKFVFSDVYKAIEHIEQKAKSYLADVVWHNLQRVKPMYQDTLGITFPQDIGTIFRAVFKRHDIVHRNGKTKSGEEILISLQDVNELIDSVEIFAKDIDTQLNELKAVV